jgi:hypothetical protein
MMPPSTLRFVERLVARHSALLPIYEEHVKNSGEVLPHVFFSDVTRWYVRLCEDGGGKEEAERLLADLEDGLARGDAEINDLIYASFLENMGGEKNTAAWRLLTPRLRAGFDLVHGYV